MTSIFDKIEQAHDAYLRRHAAAQRLVDSPCCDADDNYLPPSKRNAALTAEPAAKAGDAGVQGEDGDFMEKMVAKRRYLLLASYCGGEANCSDTRPCDDCLAMCNVFKVDDANPTYERELGPAPVAPPSPQPDMGRETDEAFCDAVWAALKGDHNDLRKQQIILKAHRAALSSPASQGVQKMKEALKWYAEQAEGCRKLGNIGDPFRNALDADGGKRAREALSRLPHKEEATPPGITKEWCLNMAGLEDGEIGAGRPDHPLRIPPVEGVTMTEDQIKHMAERFLGWKLPADFSPDGGISFNAIGNPGTRHEYWHEPVGTNLLNYEQALAMVRYLVEGLATHSATPAPVGEQGAEEWGGPLTAEEQAKIDAAWEKHKAADPVCRIPPEGWSCSRVAGHEGPCAATPATTERGRGA